MPHTQAQGAALSLHNRVCDGYTGRANSTQQQSPPYAVGDVVGYEPTGKAYNKVPIIKVNKKAAAEAAAAGYRGPSNSEPIHGQRMSDGTEPTQPVFGATVGMAMNQAIALLTYELSHDEIVQSVCEAHFWKAVHETASDVIRVSRMLEAGRLAPSVKERTAGPAPANPSPSRSPAPTRAPQPENERQAANLLPPGTVMDEDVPF